LRKAICPNIEVEARGIDRYMIHTAYRYSDDDELHILFKNTDDGWVLTDEGHTVMWLSYEDVALTDARKENLLKTIRSNHAEYADGEILVRCTLDNMGPALYSMIQALLQASMLLCMRKESIRNSFLDDMKQGFKAALGDNVRYCLDEAIDTAEKTYHADIFVDVNPPIYVFGVSNTERCLNAIIFMMHMREENRNIRSVIVVDEEAKVSEDNINMAVTKSDKSFIGIKGMNDELSWYLKKNSIVTAD
jgi:hypothetical protein